MAIKKYRKRCCEMNVKEVNKLYKKLGVPDEFFNPTDMPLNEELGHYVLLSERSTGKTTNILLWSLCANKVDGITPVYVRHTHDSIAPKNLNKLVNVIVDYGYIEKLTDGRFNTLVYRAGEWRYAAEKDGEIVEKSDVIMYALSLDRADMYKSTFNAPHGNVVIFDEFIRDYYSNNEFIKFLDLLKTIQRDREGVKVFWLANTINTENEYLYELEIHDSVLTMQPGESNVFNTSLGMPIYCNIISNKKLTKHKKIINRLLYGFNKPELNSITGGGWAYSIYPHIDRDEDKTVVSNRHYIRYMDRLMHLKVVRYQRMTLVEVTIATRTYPDSIIYTDTFPTDYRYRHGRGYTQGDRLIWNLIDTRMVRFQNNQIAALFYNFCKNA